MDRSKLGEKLMNSVNFFILLVIALLYVVTGTGLGEDAIAALSDETVYRGNAIGGVALECLVSWDAAALDDMLLALDGSGERITFFVSGRWARENADTLFRIKEAGHEIGSLGYSPGIDGDPALIERDIAASAAVIESITGETVRYYNAGLRDRETSAAAAEALDLTHIACTADLLSARGEAADIALRASKQAFDGSILMIQPTHEAAKALPVILDEIRQCGLDVTTVGAILE